MKKKDISKSRIKKKLYQMIFEEFMSKNSKNFNSPTKGDHGDSVYISKGGSIKLYYNNLTRESYSGKIDPRYSLSYRIDFEKILSKSFFGGTKTETDFNFYTPYNILKDKNNSSERFLISDIDKPLFEELKKINGIKKRLEKEVVEILEKEDKIKQEEKENKIREERKKIKGKVSELQKELDKDGNGLVDHIEENSFRDLLNKHQQEIITIDKQYVQKFVKISILLEDKKSSIQQCFDQVKKIEKSQELNNYIKIIKNLIHSYKSLLFHSVSMIVSLTKNPPDLLVFYELEEQFDRLGVFDSNHDREMIKQLQQLNSSTKDLSNKIDGVMYEINNLETSLILGLEDLSYTNQEGFENLKNSISDELKSINSSINLNNLLTGINTYQLWKVNKGLR